MARLNRVNSFRGTTKTADGCLTCEVCRTKIRKGDGYYWWANRAPGQRSSHRRIRCLDHRPKRSEMMPGRAGQLAAIEESADEQIAGAADLDAFRSIAEGIGSEVEALGDEMTEDADNMESRRRGQYGERLRSPHLSERRTKGTRGSGAWGGEEISSLDFPEAPEEPEEPSGEEQEEYEAEQERWEEDCSQPTYDKLSEVGV